MCKHLDFSKCFFSMMATIESTLRDNAEILEQCQKYKVNYILIDDEYQIDNKLNNSNQYLYICRCGVLLSRYRENRNAAFLLEY